MKMKSSMAASIVLFFLLAGALADSDSIRLPSDGETDIPRRPGPAKPWECCDNIEMSPLRIFPPLYRCNDEVKQCAAACEECVEAPGDFPRAFVCRDWYSTTDPGPFCTERPWGKCCDKAICTKSLPPICHCADEVEHCAAACKQCDRVESSEPPHYVCRDQFVGQPGPSCTTLHHTHN
ncbi:hypothetical protein ABZP36_024650 [Zizania latifolia]